MMKFTFHRILRISGGFASGPIQNAREGVVRASKERKASIWGSIATSALSAIFNCAKCALDGSYNQIKNNEIKVIAVNRSTVD